MCLNVCVCVLCQNIIYLFGVYFMKHIRRGGCAHKSYRAKSMHLATKYFMWSSDSFRFLLPFPFNSCTSLVVPKEYYSAKGCVLCTMPCVRNMRIEHEIERRKRRRRGKTNGTPSKPVINLVTLLDFAFLHILLERISSGLYNEWYGFELISHSFCYCAHTHTKKPSTKRQLAERIMRSFAALVSSVH